MIHAILAFITLHPDLYAAGFFTFVQEEDDGDSDGGRSLLGFHWNRDNNAVVLDILFFEFEISLERG